MLEQLDSKRSSGMSHYVFTPHKPATDPIQGKWVGYKAVMYNVDQNGITAVKEEIWLDPNDNGTWVKVNEFTDAGGFGDQGQVCGGKPDQIITWGGPITTFRWDKTTNVDIKDFMLEKSNRLTSYTSDNSAYIYRLSRYFLPAHTIAKVIIESHFRVEAFPISVTITTNKEKPQH